MNLTPMIPDENAYVKIDIRKFSTRKRAVARAARRGMMLLIEDLIAIFTCDVDQRIADNICHSPLINHVSDQPNQL